jgi:hypothetical protein
MEQMNPMLILPTVSHSTPVSTTKNNDLPDHQESFASVYERNKSEPESKKSVTQKSENKTVGQKQLESDSKEAANLSNKAKMETGEPTAETVDIESGIQVGISWQTLPVLTPESVETAKNESAIPSDEIEGAIAVTPDTDMVEPGSVLPGSSQESIKSADSAIQKGKSSEAMPKIASSQNVVAADISGDNAAAENSADYSAVNVVETKSQISSMKSEEKPIETAVPQFDPKVQTGNIVTETGVQTNGMEKSIAAGTKESVLNQIQQSFGKVIKSGENEIRLQLFPENLGMLNIRIIAGKEGTQVLFKTDNLQSTQLIANQVDTLKAMMTEAGIKVDQVLVSDFSFSQQSFSNQEQTKQQNLHSYTKNGLVGTDQTELWENPYEVSQSIVGLNYLA